MGECNPACVKIIINSGLVANAANQLANVASTGSTLEVAANNLADAASTLVEAHAWLVSNNAISKRTARVKWDGCEDAGKVMDILVDVANGNEVDEPAAVATLDALRLGTLGHMRDIVAGTLGE